MKLFFRAFLRCFTVFLIFGLGILFGAWLRHNWVSPEASRDRFYLQKVRTLNGKIYGDNHLHLRHVSPEIDRKLKDFDPSRSPCFIQWNWSSALSKVETTLTLAGNGELRLHKSAEGTEEILVELPPAACKAVFINTLTSGILNYSENLLKLKMDLSESHGNITVEDGTFATLRVSVPEFEVDRTISIYESGVKIQGHPQIIEFRIFQKLENEFLHLTLGNTSGILRHR